MQVRSDDPQVPWVWCHQYRVGYVTAHHKTGELIESYTVTPWRDGRAAMEWAGNALESESLPWIEAQAVSDWKTF